MTTIGYVLAELDDSDDPNLYGGLPFPDLHKAEQCARECVAEDPRVEPVILPVGAPLTAEQIAAIKAGRTDDREAGALWAAGWRPPARKITTTAELYELPGESVVITNPTPDLNDAGGAWMGYLGAWFRGPDQLQADELLARYGSVLLVWEPPHAHASHFTTESENQ